MTIKQALQNNTKRLEQKQVDRPALEAELLLAVVLGKDRVFLLAHPEQRLTPLQIIKYWRLINLKTSNWPTAYLTGHQEFFGLDFLVNRHTLIPRPETELLVESALKLIPSEGPVKVIETGTGSGCIIIAVAKNNRNAETEYQAIERSKEALKIAKKNAERHNLNQKILFQHDDLLSPIIKQGFSCPLIILANLPYLTPAQVKNSPSIQKEPKTALISGIDGLDLYRRMLSQLTTVEAPSISLVLEIDPGQTETITQLIKDDWPRAEIEILKDFRQQDRIIVAKIK